MTPQPAAARVEMVFNSRDRVNENQGAESTLSFLMALLEMQRIESTTKKEPHQEMSVSI